MDADVTDRERLQIGVRVPVRLCQRAKKALVLSEYDDGRWTLPGAAPPAEIDVGTCTASCLTTSLDGPKSCRAVATECVWLQAIDDPKRKRKVDVVTECGCTCDRTERCPEGEFWDARRCACQRKILLRPCARQPLSQQLLGSAFDVGTCRGECHWQGGAAAACRALTFSSAVADGVGSGALVPDRTVGDCGCSDCRVRPRYPPPPCPPSREGGTLALNPSHWTLGQQAQRTMIWYTELRAMKTVGQARLELIAMKQT